jgi:tryptophan 2,3-dioxygenase
MDTPLRHDLQVLLESLLGGKLPRNLSWSDVFELIGQIGEVQSHGGDEFAFVVGTQRAFFKRPHTHDLDVEEVSRLRRFLHEAGLQASAVQPHASGQVVVVIDHHAAHLYRDVGDSRPEDKTTVKPYDPFGFHHHLIHRKEAHYQGERVPEESSFYEEIAKDLEHAEEIILVGHGTGKSSAANFLSEYLKTHHPALAHKVIASETADLSALTELEIEQLAKKVAAG